MTIELVSEDPRVVSLLANEAARVEQGAREALSDTDPLSAMIGLMKNWIYYASAAAPQDLETVVEVPSLDTQFNEISPIKVPFMLMIAGVDYLNDAIQDYRSPLVQTLNDETLVDAALDEIRNDRDHTDLAYCAASYEALLTMLHCSKYYAAEPASVSPWVEAGYGGLILAANVNVPEDLRQGCIVPQLRPTFPPQDLDPTIDGQRLLMFTQQKVLSNLVGKFINK